MAQAFNNNDNSINMTGSFNNNQNSFNTNTYNTATYNYTTDDRSEILAWLSPLEPRARHQDIRARRIDTIGAWFRETEEFNRLPDGNREDASYRPTLFCDGDPGTGKSYIMLASIKHIVVGNQRIRLLIGYDDSSLVIDKLCDEAVEEDPTVACFYFDFAARNEQSPVNMLGSLLRQLVSGGKEIPREITEDFRKDKKSTGGRGFQVPGILKMLQTIIATRRIFLCVDALDECASEHRMVVLKLLSQILQASPNTHLFMAGRPHVRSEVKSNLDGVATFVLIQATEDGVFRFLDEKLRKDTIPDVMSSTQCSQPASPSGFGYGQTDLGFFSYGGGLT